MAKKSPDVSFTASNFLSFSSINEAHDSPRYLQTLWNSLPDAVKNGDLDEQLQWEGDKKKLMPILYRTRLVKAGIFLSYALIAGGSAGVAVSQFYTSEMLPAAGLSLTVSGVLISLVCRFYNWVRPKFYYCMHTHGVFIWGEVPHKNKLRKMVNTLAY